MVSLVSYCIDAEESRFIICSGKRVTFETQLARQSDYLLHFFPLSGVHVHVALNPNLDTVALGHSPHLRPHIRVQLPLYFSFALNYWYDHWKVGGDT